MRWEALRDDGAGRTEHALFDRAALAGPAERGTGRAGLAAPGVGPIVAGSLQTGPSAAGPSAAGEGNAEAGADGDAGGDAGGSLGGQDAAVAVEIRARSIINRVPGAAAVPFRWTINPYRGCSHACRYCFARRTHEYLDLDSGNDFDTKIMVKVNAGELARVELARPGWSGEAIAMGTNTDPYQRAEGRYRLMPQIIGALAEAANPFSILTKGSLILRDAALIADAARATDVGLAVSVGSLDEQIWRTVEPGTPAPQRRLDIVRRFADLGLACSVLMAPILPGLTDSREQIDHTVAAIAAAGASSLTPVVLHLRPGAREWYLGWLGAEHPGLLEHYHELYRRGAYAPAAYRERIAALVRDAERRHGLGGAGARDRPAGAQQHRGHQHRGHQHRGHAPPVQPRAEQLSLL